MLWVIYQLITMILYPLYIMVVFYSSYSKYYKDSIFWKRMGAIPEGLPSKSILVHVEGTGELLASLPLLKKLEEECSSSSIILSVLDPEAFFLARKVVSKYNVVFLPYEFLPIVWMFFNKLNLSGIIIIERALWPCFYAEAKRRRLPIMLASARMSNRSYQNYSYLKGFFARVLNCLDIIATQSTDIANCYKDLGVDKEKINVLGNLKYAINPPSEDLIVKARKSRKEWLSGESGYIIVAASTHQGEESIILDSFVDIKGSGEKKVKLIIVPRFINRSNSIVDMCKERGLSVSIHTIGAPRKEDDIIIVDVIGKMINYLAMGDCAFVGGSLIDRGGHNPLEPAKLGLSLITGPYTSNFTAVWQDLKNIKGVYNVVKDKEELSLVLNRLQSKKKVDEKVKSDLLGFMDSQEKVVDMHVSLWKSLLLQKMDIKSN